MSAELTKGWNAALKVASGLIVDDGNPAVARRRILELIDDPDEFESDHSEGMGGKMNSADTSCDCSEADRCRLVAECSRLLSENVALAWRLDELVAWVKVQAGDTKSLFHEDFFDHPSDKVRNEVLNLVLNKLGQS